MNVQCDTTLKNVMKYPPMVTTSLIYGTTCALSPLLSEPERIESARLCSLTGQYIKYGCRNGLLGYIDWRNRFQGSLNFYTFGLWSLDSSAGWVAPIPVPGISCRLRLVLDSPAGWVIPALVPGLTCGLSGLRRGVRGRDRRRWREGGSSPSSLRHGCRKISGA
jgi:hypothetical protein